MSENGSTVKKKRDRIGLILYGLYLVMLIASAVLIGKLIYIQAKWSPDEALFAPLTPQNTSRVLEPIRGNILDRNGRLLAMSYPMYVLHMDCTVGIDEEWQEKVVGLSEGLAGILRDKSSKDYLKAMRDGREAKQRYLAIGKLVDRKTLNKIKELPLFNEGRNKGGLIIEQKNVRKYPYGELARRTIGFVRESTPGVSNNMIGLEGKFDGILHGTDGKEWFRMTDKGQVVQDFDSVYVKPVNGADLHTTLDIDYQGLADKALRSHIEGETDIECACLVLMEVKTGAIRAMVNLKKNPKTGKFEESENIAIGHRNEPGSVFKTVTLLSVLSDNYITSLEQKMPTASGRIAYARVDDQHIRDFENAHKCKTISVLDGFKMSSNYVFAKLALDNYAGDKTQDLMDNIRSFGLIDPFDFDLDGLQNSNIPYPKTNVDLARVGYGYATELCPLQVLTFYNAIAGKGRLMKPYLVNGPEELSSSICTKAVADTVTRALRAVIEEGTARRSLAGCKTAVAGKTGTSFATIEKGKRGGDPYHDTQNRQKYQGTFVGFFPADDPQYSIISSIFTAPTAKNTNFQGGGIPARAIKELIDGMYTIDPYWQETQNRCN